MDKDPDVDIIELADTIKKEEPKLAEIELDKRYDDQPRFINRTEKALLIAGAVVLVISIAVFLTSGGIYLSKSDFDILIKRVDRIEERLAEIERKPQYHVVAPGETLPLIAQKYGLTVDELLNFNGMIPVSPFSQDRNCWFPCRAPCRDPQNNVPQVREPPATLRTSLSPLQFN